MSSHKGPSPRNPINQHTVLTHSRMPKALHRRPSPIKKDPKKEQKAPISTHRSRTSALLDERSCFTDPIAFEKFLSESFNPVHKHHSTPFSPTESILSGVTSLSLVSSTSSHRSSAKSHSRHRPSQTSTMPPSKPSSSKSSKSGRDGSGTAHRGSSGKGRRTAPSSQFQCDICGQFYSRRDNLRVHQRVHSGEMPYDCKYCGQEFRWMGALRSHEKNHERDGDVIGATAPSSYRGGRSGSGRGSSHHSSSHSTSSSRQPVVPRPSSSSRNSSSRSQDPERHSQNGASASSRDRRTSSSSSRSRTHAPPLNLDLLLPRGEDVMITDEDPVVSPMFHEPWHRVLDDEQ